MQWGAILETEISQLLSATPLWPVARDLHAKKAWSSRTKSLKLPKDWEIVVASPMLNNIP